MVKVKNNRRKYGRMPLEYSVEVTAPSKIKDAQTSDISIRGLCLITPMPLKENSVIKMKLSLDDEEPILIPIQGKVVWKMKKKEKEYHHGILITDIKGDKKEPFRKFLATKLIEFLLK
ncbi:MAG: PilZ domain-containing protein [Candidatus Kaelpia aquatica]|nr:PilZ domain-containing protein [Candidatus Kaelpia aquatica]